MVKFGKRCCTWSFPYRFSVLQINL